MTHNEHNDEHAPAPPEHYPDEQSGVPQSGEHQPATPEDASAAPPPGEYVDPITGGPVEHTTEPMQPPPPVVAGARMSKFGGYLLGLIRILLGWQFLWAFLDKTFGFGRATPSADAWIHGGRPTAGYLAAVTGKDSDSPLKSFFKIFEGHAWADWLFMIGLAGIGVCLLVGLGMWIACISGAVLLLLMYAASLPIAQNPFLDEHLLDAILLIALLGCNAGAYLGLGKRWKHRVRRTEGA